MLLSPALGYKQLSLSVRIACEKSASGISDGQQFLALPAVDARIRDVGKTSQMEHRFNRKETLRTISELFLNLSANGKQTGQLSMHE